MSGPTRIGDRYELEELLGRGGMGEVWRARHLALNSHVAIKFLHGGSALSETASGRFVREAQVAAQLKNRHAVQVFDFGVTEDNRPYIVMELLEGESLATRLARQGRLPVASAVRFLGQVAKALERAHALGIVHRDLKPDNVVIVLDDDGKEMAKVLDFGIAKLVGDLEVSERAAELPPSEPSSKASFTRTESLLGTPLYMSPEQIKSAAAVDLRSDVWAFGVLAYQCLTGSPPFDGPDLASLFQAIGAREHVAPTTRNGELPEAFDAWFDVACALDASARFPSARVAATELERAFGLAPAMVDPAPSGPRVSLPSLPEEAFAPTLDHSQGAAMASASSSAASSSAAKSTAGTLASTRPAADAPAKPRRGSLAAGVLLGLASISALGIWTWRHLRSSGARETAASASASPSAPNAEATKDAPRRVLVADFENRTGDPVFDGTMEPVLASVLAQSSRLVLAERQRASEDAAKLSPADPHLHGDVALAVARKEHVDMLVTGFVERGAGETYRCGVATLDPRTGASTFQDQKDAPTKDATVGATRALAARVLYTVGDVSVPSGTAPASVEAAHWFALGLTASDLGRYRESIDDYEKALALDPTLVTAHRQMAVQYANLHEPDKAEAEFKLALAHLDEMSEDNRLRTRAAYYAMAQRDWTKAIAAYKEILDRNPTSTRTRSDLALAYFYSRDMSRALQEGRKVAEEDPDSPISWGNLGLYAMYAGRFDVAVAELRRTSDRWPQDVPSRSGLVLTLYATGQRADAEKSLSVLSTLGQDGASLASLETADMALYDGRVNDAIAALEAGSARDHASGDSGAEAVKLAALAQAYAARGYAARAAATAERAAASTHAVSILYLTARVLRASGRPHRAKAFETELASRLEPEARHYGKLLEGEALLDAGKPRDALESFGAAQALTDSWMGRFDLGLAYLALDAFVDASEQLETCLKRRGEAIALFLDDLATYRFLAPVYYYLGRAQQGLGDPGAAESFRTFLAVREHGDAGDRLVADAKKR